MNPDSSVDVFKSKRVMIIGADPFYRSILTRVVAQVIIDAQVLTVDNYKKSIELIRQSVSSGNGAQPFDLIIADLNFNDNEAGIDIWKVCKVRSPQAHFLIISRTPLNEFMAMMGAQTTDEAPSYLPKPFRPDQCRNMLVWMLRRSQSRVA